MEGSPQDSPLQMLMGPDTLLHTAPHPWPGGLPATQKETFFPEWDHHRQKRVIINTKHLGLGI